MRSWVCGKLVVDGWTDHAATDERSSSVGLAAGQRYEVRMEYYENGGGAVAKLPWDHVGYRTHVVPQKQLCAAP